MSILQRVPWTVQPQIATGIDWGNPITRGLVAAILPSVTYNDFLSPATTVSTFGTAPVKSPGIAGVGPSSKAATGGIYLTASDNRYTGAAQSHFMLADISAIVGDYAGLIGTSKGDGSAGSISIQRNGSLNSYRVYNNPTNGSAFGNTTDIVGAGLKAVTLTADANNPTNWVAYLNQAVWGSGTVTSGVTTQTTGRLLTLSERSVSASVSHQGIWFLRLAWNRILSAQEVASLATNPWQIFTPLQRRIWVPGAGVGGAITIDCTPGNAVAAGVTCAVKQDINIACSLGNAVAAGITASLPIMITASVGNAVAAGTTASVTQAVTINTTLGNAVAAGVTAVIELGNNITIDASVGDAIAAGVAATIAQAFSVACGVGDAVAAGTSSSITLGDPLHGFTQDQLDFLVAYMEANMSFPTAADIAAAVLAAAVLDPISADVKQINNVALAGAGTPADPMRPA